MTAVLLWEGAAPGARGTAAEDTPRLTPYLQPGGPSACVIVLPGGGYGGRAAHEGEPIARWLNGLGLAAFVCDYRVAPYRHPIPLGDAQRAIRSVRARAAEWRIDPARVGVLGFSAGGHLAASTAVFFDGGRSGGDAVDRQPSRPDAAILCYPVISFDPAIRHDGSMRNLLGDPPDDDLARLLSLEERVSPQTPPVFLWHTADDQAVPVENSLRFAAAARRHRVDLALHVFPRGRHGLGLAADDAQVGLWTTLCAAWLRGLGFAPASASARA